MHEPMLSFAYFNRAEAKREIGDLKGFIEDLKESILLENKKASELFTETFSESTDYQEINYVISGDTKKENEDYKGAIDDYTLALKTIKNHYMLYINRADCFNEIKEYRKVIEDLETAIKINPNYRNAYGQLATAKSKFLDDISEEEEYEYVKNIIKILMKGTDLGDSPSYDQFINLAKTFKIASVSDNDALKLYKDYFVNKETIKVLNRYRDFKDDKEYMEVWNNIEEMIKKQASAGDQESEQLYNEFFV